ncbi:unnamed protein product, partial [marine sediment metagenome]
MVSIEIRSTKKEKLKAKKRVAILGSTGSVGKQALEVVENLKDEIEVVALSANRNIQELENQILKFNPEAVWVTDKKSAEKLRNNLKKLPKKITEKLNKEKRRNKVSYNLG